MMDAIVFCTGLAITLGASLLAVSHLKSHLRNILTDLCGTKERAAFWTAFSNLTLVIVPLIFAMHRTPSRAEGSQSVFQVATQIEWALVGLLVSVVLLGIVIGRSIRAALSDRLSLRVAGSVPGVAGSRTVPEGRILD
jgi:hypothetical protein